MNHYLLPECLGWFFAKMKKTIWCQAGHNAIVATRTKRGFFRVLARQYIEEWKSGNYHWQWVTIHDVKNIKSPSVFIGAVIQCESELHVEIDITEVVAALEQLDINFAARVSQDWCMR